MSDRTKEIYTSKERFKPKRRNLRPKRRGVNCVKCDFYEPVENEPCLWKLEAQLDAIQQHINIAVSLMRKITAKKRQQVKMERFMKDLQVLEVNVKALEELLRENEV
jgi:hypothetical protein